MNILNLALEGLLVVTTGLNHIADQLSGGVEADMSDMGVGTGTTGEVAGNTALETELARVALDSVTQSANKVKYVGIFLPGVGTGALTEVGIFNDPTAGVMMSRSTYPVKNKDANDTYTITVEDTYSAV